jgi:hypothetical protein
MPAKETWTQQRRDERGRFGNLPAPTPATPPTLAQAKAVTYGAIGHLPAAQRAGYETQLAMGGLGRLTESLMAWHAAAHLDRMAFRERFLGGVGSDDLVDHLRKAASGATATTTAELSAATAELAAAHQLMGSNAWPRFVATARGRAATVAAAADMPGEPREVAAA